jgi:hypothetical protein
MKRFFALLICILAVFSFCACEDNANVTPDGKKVAGRDDGNDAVQYTFFYPENWEMVRNSATIELKLDCNQSSGLTQYATISVVGFELTGDDIEMTARQYWNDKYIEEVKGLYDNFEMENEEGEELSLDEVPALGIEYKGEVAGTKYYCEQVICIRYGTVYIISLVVPDGNQEQVEGALDTVVKDFKFEKSIF